MDVTVWLKVEAKKKYQRWVPGNIHAFKTKPSTRDNEIAVKVDIQIPDAVFEEPVFEAKLVLPEVTRQFPEKTEIAKHLGAALSERMGFRVKVDMTEPLQPSTTA